MSNGEQSKNNDKFRRFVKQFMLLIAILGVVGSGSFIANYWQDRESVKRNSAAVLRHEERLRELENNQAMIAEVLKGINKALDEVCVEIKTSRDERKELSKELEVLKEKSRASLR